MIVLVHATAAPRHAGKRPRLSSLLITVLLIAVITMPCQNGLGATRAAPARLSHPIIVTQQASNRPLAAGGSPWFGALRPDEQPMRLVLVSPDSSARLFSDGFYSACDPEVSFDGTRLLFAGKRGADESWNIYEAALDGRSVRQITQKLGDCRSPCYQGTLYTLDSPAPWRQITFVSNVSGLWNECNCGPLTNLYSCKPDGSAVRRLTFNLSNDAAPCLLGDGRLLLASWQRCTLERGRLGYTGLFAVNLDGTDYSLFAENRGKRIKHMPCVTASGLVVFVESDEVAADGSGTLASVAMRRPLHSYRAITGESDGRFRGPSPLPDGRILVCRRSADGAGNYGVCCLDPVTGRYEMTFHDPRFHAVAAKLVHSRPEPDGRSSNVHEDDPLGSLYCLDVYSSELKHPGDMPRGTAKRLRVLEGVPRKVDDSREPAASASRVSGSQRSAAVCGPMAPRRILGEAPVEEDGSFNIAVPANTPIQLQLLDDRGMALRSCAWIWTMNHESRGCIGCHEDGELVPEDRFAKALGKPSVVVSPAPVRRRAVDFRHDVAPIVRNKCLECHRKGQNPPYFAEGPGAAEEERAARQVYEQLLAPAEAGAALGHYGKYVHPGKTRTSPLAWHLFGQSTSRPWDEPVRANAWKPIPASGNAPLTEEEKRVFVEWIDTGAAWDCRPAIRDAGAKGPDKGPAANSGATERGGM